MTSPTSPTGDPHQVPAEIITEWEPGTFAENLAPGPEDSWLVTLTSHRRVDRVAADGSREVFAEVSGMPTGIVADGDGALVVSGDIGQEGWRLDRVGESGVEKVCDLPELRFGNGMARSGEQLFVTDSARGLLLAVAPGTGRSTVWLEHELLSPAAESGGVPGVNGVTVRGEHLYLTSTSRALVLRVRLGATAGDLEIVAEQLLADDFDIHPDGRMFLATHVFDSVRQLEPDGSHRDIAGRDQGIETSTAVAVDPRDSTRLWVTTAGERFGSPHREKPARLVRLTV
ncbi:SMP-30/gluconolactonase/LRE family protein [Pseudonocardia adelaidensis]|uniref:Sugar lactone lactonase YvrE n=1 Tax=Pseudonocardia adelaidensis TaxID=648754 RepID=A0ABP9P8K9_9PSEU